MYGFIAEYNYSRRSLITKGSISNPFTKQKYKSNNFIWDTGATISSIDQDIASKLNLPSISIQTIETANGTVKLPVYPVDIILDIGLDNFQPIFRLFAVGSKLAKETDVLIGMDIISKGSFLFSKHKPTGRLFFEFCSPALHSLINPSIIQEINKQKK